jgi:hypothetical protein
MNERNLNRRIDLLLEDCKRLLARIEIQGEDFRDRSGQEVDRILAKISESFDQFRDAVTQQFEDIRGEEGVLARLELAFKRGLVDLLQFPIEGYEGLCEEDAIREIERLSTLLALARVRVRERRGQKRPAVFKAVERSMARVDRLRSKDTDAASLSEAS